MAGETVHWVECLPCYHEDLSLMLKTHIKSKQINKLGMEMHSANLMLEEWILRFIGLLV